VGVTQLSRIRLLEADPDLGRFLAPDERHEASALVLPLEDLDTGPLDAEALLDRHGAFGAFVVDGMLACHLRVGEQAGMRLLGPGDLLSPGSAPPSMLLVDRGCRVVAQSRVALLGRDAVVGVHRWPMLLAGLHARAAEQIERVAVQLAICQLPRVEDRLLALLWLLAETWGRVTPAGTSLPVNLTHETLGALIGARRPTVTLALGELIERGAVLRQGRAWLLIERPPQPAGAPRPPHAPELVPERPSPWGRPEEPVIPTAAALKELGATVERLQREHEAGAETLRRRVDELHAARERNRAIRESVREDVRRPRPAPS
jgi:CRP/FNR family cyclic AMP-dependent transcriptional regulator